MRSLMLLTLALLAAISLVPPSPGNAAHLRERPTGRAAAFAAHQPPFAAAPASPAQASAQFLATSAVTPSTYLPLIWRSPIGLSGQVVRGVAPVAGASIQLTGCFTTRYGVVCWPEDHFASTDTDGRYVLSDVASLTDTEYLAYAPFFADAQPDRLIPQAELLAEWRGALVFTYTAGFTESFAPIDLAAPALVAPAPGAIVTPTITFTWQPRQEPPGLEYYLEVGRMWIDGSIVRLWGSEVIDPAAGRYELQLKQPGMWCPSGECTSDPTQFQPGGGYVWRMRLIGPYAKTPQGVGYIQGIGRTFYTGTFSITSVLSETTELTHLW